MNDLEKIRQTKIKLLQMGDSVKIGDKIGRIFKIENDGYFFVIKSPYIIIRFAYEKNIKINPNSYELFIL